MNRYRVIYISCLYVGLVLQPVAAEEITIAFEGQVESVITERNCWLDDSIAQGTIISGTCIHDTTYGDQDSSEHHGLYWLQSIEMNIGDYTFSYEWSPIPAFFEVWAMDVTYLAYCNATALDGNFIIGGLDSFDQISWNTLYMKPIDLCNASSTGTDEFPLSIPDISFFYYRNDFDINFYDINGNGFSIDGYLTDISIIPEPGSLSLLVLGSTMLWRRFGQVSRIK